MKAKRESKGGGGDPEASPLRNRNANAAGRTPPKRVSLSLSLSLSPSFLTLYDVVCAWCCAMCGAAGKKQCPPMPDVASIAAAHD